MASSTLSTQYNTRSASVRRLMKEAKEMCEPTDMYFAQPLEENLFEWHFTVRGPAESDFAGGIYHGRILFPPDYPMKPPNLILLTPNGRFELNKKICLSISGYHPETWLPSWSVRTALLALIGFMPTDGAGAIGSLSYPPEERHKLAKQSGNWRCKECQVLMKEALLPVGSASKLTEEEARALIAPSQEKEEKNEEVSTVLQMPSLVSEGSSEPRVTSDSPDGTAPSGETSPSSSQSGAEPPRTSSPSSHSIRFQPRPPPSSLDFISLFVYAPVLILCLSLFFGLAYRRFYVIG